MATGSFRRYGDANIHSAFSMEALVEIVNEAVVSAKSKLQQIQSAKSSISIGDMFEMQMLMNQLAQFSEMATGVVAAAHNSIMSMARNVKS